MGFVKRLLGIEPNLTKLLSVRIVTDEDHNYFISFSKHHPQLQLPEFARLILHYYAKILFNFDPSDPDMSQSAFILKNMMHSVLADGIRKDSNILQSANIDDVAMIVSSPTTNVPRKIVATLFFVDTAKRHITTDIPANIYAQHMVFSVMVLLQVALREMDQNCIDILNLSLANMNAAYDSGQSYSDMYNLTAIPTIAYMSAIMTDMADEEMPRNGLVELIEKGPSVTVESDELLESTTLSQEHQEFIRDKIRHGDRLACKLWTEQLDLDETPIQARHAIATIIAAVASGQADIKSDALIALAALHFDDPQFGAFLREANVRQGLRRLVRDTLRAARASDVRKLSELVQSFLLLPVGGPEALSASEARSVVDCSATICTDCMAEFLPGS